MIYNSVTEIFEAIDKTRNELLEHIAAIPQEKMYFKANEKTWSPAEIVEHLAKTEAELVPLFFKLLKSAEAAPVPSDGTINPPISFAEIAPKFMDVKLEAPEMIKPGANEKIEDSLVKLEQSRQMLRGLQSRLKAVDLSKPVYPHPFLGNMNLYQWLAFIGLHEMRHLSQIRRVGVNK